MPLSRFEAPMHRSGFPSLVVSLTLVALPFLCTPLGTRQAQARWKPEYANSRFSAWYEQQHDKDGWSCCDHGDAHAVFDPVFKHGKWHVRIDGVEYQILPHQLLDGPNPTGHAVVWYDGAGDHATIFCFAPGALS